MAGKCNVNVEYRKALRQMIADAREITGSKKVPSHLRVAVKSHAQHLAQVRCDMKRRGELDGYSKTNRKSRRQRRRTKRY